MVRVLRKVHPTEGAPKSKRPRHHTWGRQSEFRSRDDSDPELSILPFFWPRVTPYWILAPDLGLKLCPLQWQHRLARQQVPLSILLVIITGHLFLSQKQHFLSLEENERKTHHATSHRSWPLPLQTFCLELGLEAEREGVPQLPREGKASWAEGTAYVKPGCEVYSRQKLH